MILVVDVGNTNIVLGVYKEEELISTWRMTTHNQRTSDELGIYLINLFNHNKLDYNDLEGVIISSVVPDINYSLNHAIRKYFNIKPIVVGPGIKTGIDIRIENPKELGADRLVNAVGAYYLYGGPSIVIDFGTATTYDVVSGNGEFISGITAPGIKISAEALYNKAAQLPKIEIKKPKSILAKNTIDSMQAGLVYGYIGQVEYIINEIKKELGIYDIKVIATGGLSGVIYENTNLINELNRRLTLEGLKIIYKKNS